MKINLRKNKNEVTISRGLGAKPISVSCSHQGEPLDAILRRAKVRLESHESISIGKRPVKNMETVIRPGDLIVVTRNLNNGRSLMV